LGRLCDDELGRECPSQPETIKFSSNPTPALEKDCCINGEIGFLYASRGMTLVAYGCNEMSPDGCRREDMVSLEPSCRTMNYEVEVPVGFFLAFVLSFGSPEASASQQATPPRPSPFFFTNVRYKIKNIVEPT
jgi:hypothetical protein